MQRGLLPSATHRSSAANSHWARFTQLLLISLLVTLTLGPATAVDAQTNENKVAEITLNRWSVGSQNNAIVEVAVEAQRAVNGTLVVTNQTADGFRYQFPVTAAAQTTVLQTISVASPFGDISLDVELVEDDKLLAQTQLQANTFGQGTNTAVALLGFDQPDNQSKLVVDDLEVGLYPIEDLTTIGSFDTLVVEPSIVRQLDETEQSHLTTWLSVGGQLMVAGEPGAIDDRLPEQWRSTNEVVAVDSGLIRYVGSSWESELTPGLNSVSSQGQGSYDNDFDNELFSDAQITLPPLGGLLGALLIYVLLIGPVLYIGLRIAKKSTLLWVVVPAVALVTSGAVLGIGLSLVSSRTSVHASTIEITPSGSFATSSILLTDPGEKKIEAPAGWLGEPTDSGSYRDTSDSSLQPRLEPQRDKTVATLRVSSGNVGLLRMQGPLDEYANALSITIDDVSETQISGSVTNNSGVDLKHSIVSIGTYNLSIGTVPDGETAPFILETAPGREEVVTRYEEQELWPDNSEAVSTSKWLNLRANRQGTLLGQGTASVTGWTTELSSPLGPKNGRTALVARTALQQWPTSRHGIRSAIMTVPGDQTTQDSQVVQFIRSSGTPEMALRPGTGNATEIWDGSTWQQMGEGNEFAISLAIAEDLWVNNTLYVREQRQDRDPLPILVPADGETTDPSRPTETNSAAQDSLDETGIYQDEQVSLPPDATKRYQLRLREGDEVFVEITPTSRAPMNATWLFPGQPGIDQDDDVTEPSLDSFSADVVAPTDGIYTLEISNSSTLDGSFDVEMWR